MSQLTAPMADVVREGLRVLDAGSDVPLRLLGGVAIAVSLTGEPLLPRPYNDIDFITARGEGPTAARLFQGLGYEGDHQFNGLNGHRRLLFYDAANERRVDVFVGRFEMSHMWPLERRLTITEKTIPLGDLLLTKLQIFAINEKDQRDILNLLYGHKLTESDTDGINAAYIAQRCGSDWGLWRTATFNIERARTAVPRFDLQSHDEAIVISRLDDLRKQIDAEPKSTKWKLRARVGERVQWYEEPEEVG
ncbi:MAG: nucleotidyltransferase family protein [Actinobacteria bacterium]|nr:MAG: nucleotidyltransferase family protein [Actinomycetota bacterium]